MAQLLQVSIGKRTALVYEFGKGLPAIEADEAQVRQVVMNLILNAAEAIGDRNGTISLGLRARALEREELSSRWTGDGLAPGEYVELEVRDSGAGMSDETLARIFDPFFSTKFTGRGLGLAAVLGIVRAHRGTIHVDSKPGRGTAFRVLLPACGRPAAATAPPASGEPWHASGVALVVDDEDSVRRLAAAMLARMGFGEVILARGGREGIERFRERSAEIRVVLLDVTMPDMDGETVLAAMRAHRADARIILSSGYSVPSWQGTEGPQADGFIGKPYRLEDLTAAVRGALEGART
jgi:CheY-like chemotaxis protein